MSPKIDRYKAIWSAVLLLAWTAVILLFIHMDGQLTLEELLRFKPQKPVYAELLMQGLFLLKGLDFVLPSGLLYAANGVMFSQPLDLALNLLGAAVMLTPGYFVGKVLGQPIVRYIEEKHPKFRRFADVPLRSELTIAILLRAVGLPVTAASVYMGAVRMRFGPYLLGSLLGLTPLIIAYTVMGDGLGDLSSPEFRLAYACRWAVAIAAALLSARILRQGQSHQEADNK